MCVGGGGGVERKRERKERTEELREWTETHHDHPSVCIRVIVYEGITVFLTSFNVSL